MRRAAATALLIALLGLLPGSAAATEAPSYEEAPPAYTPPPARTPKVHFSGFRRNVRSGTAILFVSVPGPGRVILHGRGIRRLVRVVGRPRRLRLVVRPKVRLMHYLKHHRKGRIRAVVTFRPGEGAPEAIERPIALKRRHHRRR